MTEADPPHLTSSRLEHAGNTRPCLGPPPDEVLRIDPGGTITARFALAPEESSGFETELGGLALAPDGSIWVTTPLDGKRLIHLAADGSACRLHRSTRSSN